MKERGVYTAKFKRNAVQLSERADVSVVAGGAGTGRIRLQPVQVAETGALRRRASLFRKWQGSSER